MNLSSLPSLYFESVGRGPDVVLVHGWGLHGGVWSRVAQALADEFTVHCVDLPGHGHSASLQDYTLDNLARALAVVQGRRYGTGLVHSRGAGGRADRQPDQPRRQLRYLG